MKQFLEWLYNWLGQILDDKDRRILKVYDKKHKALDVFTRVRSELEGVVENLTEEILECDSYQKSLVEELKLNKSTSDSLEQERESILDTIERISGLID